MTDDLMTTHTPYLVEITYIAEQPGISVGQPVQSKIDAIEAASYITPLHAETEAIDAVHGMWHVWLPNYMTKDAWATGLDIDLRAGGFRLFIDYERN